MLARAARSTAAVARVRAMSSAPAAAVEWDALRSKMLDDHSRAALDSARAAYEQRMRAATATTSVPGIDWEAYAKALPDIDIEAVRADYEKFQATVPDVPYDAAADAARAAADREVFEDVAAYASGRISELAETAIEQEDHKLHDHYTVARLFQRFDGQFEKEWLEWRKVNLVGNLRTLSEVSEVITPEQKREVVAAMADKLGVSPSSLGRSG